MQATTRIRRAVSRATQELRTTLADAGLDRSYFKVFAIGENKTGTTSIDALLSKLGFASYHDRAWVPSKARRVHRQWQAFSDGPPEDFRHLDRTYPRSKFLLNVRQVDEWLDSRLAHIAHEEAQGKISPNPLWRATEENVRRWILMWHRHHLDVMAYFSNRPKDLLVVDFIRDPDAAGKIGRFLGRSGPGAKPFVRPIEKTREPGQLRHHAMIEAAFTSLGVPPEEWQNDLMCPSLLNAPSRFPPDTSLL